MKEHYLKLLGYNAWTNRRFLASMLENTVMNNKIFLLFSHLLTAEEVWLCRAKGVGAPVQRLWEVYPNETLQLMLADNSQAWIDYVNSLEESSLATEVSYRNTKGESFSTRLDDIITHLVNHGTHHRAQIASMLQQEKIQPPVSDYVVYVREQKATLVV